LGTYALSIASQVVPSGSTITGNYQVLDVTAVTSGMVSVGAMIPNGAAGAFVTGQLTGTGNVGTYIVSGTPTASGAMVLNTAVETKWFATSAGNPGELIKMSSWQLG
jgi:hypothetical protein